MVTVLPHGIPENTDVNKVDVLQIDPAKNPPTPTPWEMDMRAAGLRPGIDKTPENFRKPETEADKKLDGSAKEERKLARGVAMPAAPAHQTQHRTAEHRTAEQPKLSHHG